MVVWGSSGVPKGMECEIRQDNDTVGGEKNDGLQEWVGWRQAWSEVWFSGVGLNKCYPMGGLYSVSRTCFNWVGWALL